MYRALMVLSWLYRIAGALVLVAGPLLVLWGLRMSETVARLAAERGIVAEPYNPVPGLLTMVALGFTLLTVGLLIGLAVDVATNTRASADALARIRGKR